VLLGESKGEFPVSPRGSGWGKNKVRFIARFDPRHRGDESAGNSHAVPAQCYIHIYLTAIYFTDRVTSHRTFDWTRLYCGGGMRGIRASDVVNDPGLPGHHH